MAGKVGRPRKLFTPIGESKISGKFEVIEKEAGLDMMASVRGDKKKLLYQLAQDVLKLDATKTLSLGTEEEFIKYWGTLKANKTYIIQTLKVFGVDHPVVMQHGGRVLVWNRV